MPSLQTLRKEKIKISGVGGWSKKGKVQFQVAGSDSKIHPNLRREVLSRDLFPQSLLLLLMIM